MKIADVATLVEKLDSASTVEACHAREGAP